MYEFSKKVFKSVDEYINTFSGETKARLQSLRDLFKSAVPEAQEAISYNIPTFKLNGKYLVYFAGYKNHISIYPIPRVDEELGKELLPFVKGKGTLQFPLSSPLPLELILRVLDCLLKDNIEKSKSN